MRPAKDPAHSKTVCPVLKGSVDATPALLIRPATGNSALNRKSRRMK